MRNIVFLSFLIVVGICLLGCDEAKQDKQGRHIQDYIDNNKVEISTYSAGIESITLNVHNKTFHAINVLIPAGTLLSPNSNSYQTMLCYEDESMTIGWSDSEDISINVVCTNINKKAPNSELSFTMNRESENVDLNTFVRNYSTIDKVDFDSKIGRSIDYELLQSATWILTDNARFDDMWSMRIESQRGLFSTNHYFISSDDIASSMMLLNLCGINLESYGIIEDKSKIFRFLDDEDEKKLKDVFETTFILSVN